MSLNRYEHLRVVGLIDGYMIGSATTPNVIDREAEFVRAKNELLGHLRRQIKQVEAFTFQDMSKQVS